MLLEIPMYAQAIAQCVQAVKSMETYLDKAERLADAKKFDVGILLSTRLAPDMGGLLYQIQSACDYLKGGAAWLSGQQPPQHEDNEQTLDEARARIRKTIDFVESVAADRYADAAGQIVKVTWVPGKLTGENYLLQIVIPNIYFHVAMAYAILRTNGVDLKKLDFIGPVNAFDA
ncbi:DUF1993 domain-containing protein [Paraburkholderia azotifigens]|uniref:DUF1993 domain-containing protein n=2 Tax=Paraburkholderia azotifigens TaxID=2057004 RepID=A0ABU9QZX3_9BURK|nr:DUF1993 domain-containing protein [Paraburkholderia azotifigens]